MGTGALYSTSIDIIYEVAYIRTVPLQDGGPRAIEFGLANGTNWRLSGGLYYPEAIVASTMMRNDRGHILKSEVAAEDVLEDSSATGHAVRKGIGVLGTTVAKSGSKFASKGTVAGVSFGFGLSYLFSSVLMLMGSVVNTFLGPLGISASWGLTGTQIFTFTTYAGSLGLATGAAVGLGVGLFFGIPMGLVKTIHEFIHKHRELRISASEKLFAKLYCHRSFKSCDGEGSIIVPLQHPCPHHLTEDMSDLEAESEEEQ